ncbi:MFS transporter [Streptomyces bacillaris]|uniref:MFS transporter n=1 Tax=Streptomyces bacillaris TaxID=68179 RepID=UPI0034613292
MNAYRQVLVQPGATRLFLSVLTARLTPSVLSLSLLLAARTATGSYATASLALAGHALALAATAPALGRLCDRVRPASVLLASLAAHLAAYAGLLTALHTQTAPALLVTTAVLVGATTPPASAVVRGIWPRVVPPGHLHTAYALDSVSNEATFITGPLLVAALSGITTPATLIAAGAGATALGILALAAAPAARTAAAPTPGSASRRGSALGPLAHRPVRSLLIIAAAGTFSIGTLQVGAAASAAHWGNAGAAGYASSALSAGAVIGGLLYGSRRFGAHRLRQLTALYAASAAALAATATAPALPFLAAAFALTGLVSGARDTLEQTLLGDASPNHQRTETFAWLTTFMWAGFALGSAAAGQLTTRLNPAAPYLAGAAACLAATLTAALLARNASPDRAAPEATPVKITASND